jgi:outer membrane protein assembly factor BamB
MRPLPLLLVLLASSVSAQTWSQWGGGPRHNGSLAVAGQQFNLKLAETVVDPFVDQLRSEAGGTLLVHYQTPLSDGPELFMELKSGTYTEFRSWQTQNWGVRKFAWERGALVTRWTAQSDWDPAPSGSFRFEPVFHAALGDGVVYMPGAGGTVLEVDRESGAILRRLGLFAPSVDPSIYVTSPIVVGDDGTLYYNALKPQAANPWGSDHAGAWLVKIAPDGTASRVSYSALVAGEPAPNAQCTFEFGAGDLPWPPSPSAVAPSTTCGTLRAGINLAPAVDANGVVYTVAKTHLNARWGWLIAVNPDLTPKWTASLRNRFDDGCNVLLPPNGQPGGCRFGAVTGVDPADNQRGSGSVNDNSTASPIVAPDGSIYYGTFTRYNHSQGHMVRFSADGQFLASYPFGWDVTPAVWAHDGTFSIVTKENRYAGVGTYCGSPQWCPPARIPGDDEGYYITQLSAELEVQWKFRSASAPGFPFGFEWCVNALAVDSRGVVYVNSEDGHLYAIDQGGTMRERIFLQLALGAAYTPLSLGTDGKIYTQNAGRLFAVGSGNVRRRAAGKGNGGL